MSDYYEWEDKIGKTVGLEGAGIIGIILGDQLHPPMVYDKKIWKDGRKWREGALICVRRLAEVADVKGKKILDVGCGVGGPGRILATEYDCNVASINISGTQLRTSKRITLEQGIEEKVLYVRADAESIPFRNSYFDVIWTFNMFYHVQDKKRAIQEFNRTLREKGTLAFDDWTLTDKIDEGEHNLLKHDWVSGEWIDDKSLFALLESNGFEINHCEDYSRVHSLMSSYFSPVFERRFKKKIRKIDKFWGNMTSNHFKRAVERTIQFYKEDKMRYLQIVATKK